MSVQKLQLETANFHVSKKTPPTKVPEGGPSDSPKVWERCGTRAPRSPSSKMTFFKCSTRRQAGFSAGGEDSPSSIFWKLAVKSAAGTLWTYAKFENVQKIG